MFHCYTTPTIGSRISLRAANNKPLSTLQRSRLRRTLLHDLIRLLVRPKLKVIRTITRLTDLPRHPRHPQIIEHLDMVFESLRFVLARSAKLFKQHELVSLQVVLQSNRTLGSELLDAAVRVDVDDVEGVAGPVLGDVGVGEFVASTWLL